MKSLPAIFTLTVGILLTGMIQVGRSDSILAVSSANATATMTSFSAGIQQPAPPDANPSDPATPRTSTDITVTHEKTTRSLNNPLWWAIGAVVVVSIIAIIAISARGKSGTTVVRG